MIANVDLHNSQEFTFVLLCLTRKGKEKIGFKQELIGSGVGAELIAVSVHYCLGVILMA